MVFVTGNPNRKVRARVNQIAFDSSTFTYYQQKTSPVGSLWKVYTEPQRARTFESLTGKPTTLAGYGITDAIAIINTITNVTGSVSGSVDFAQPFNSPAYKRVAIYMKALVGAANYTFPVPFLHAPQILSDSAPRIATITLLSATAVRIVGAGQTGFIELNGW